MVYQYILHQISNFEVKITEISQFEFVTVIATNDLVVGGVMGEKRGLLQKSPQLFLMLTYGIERISSFSDAFFLGVFPEEYTHIDFHHTASLKHTKKNLVYWGKLHLVFLTKFNYWLKGSLSLSLLGGVAAFFLSRQQKRKFRKAVGRVTKKVYLFAPF